MTSEPPEFQIIALNEMSQVLLLPQIKYDGGSLGHIESPSLLIFAPVSSYLRKHGLCSHALIGREIIHQTCEMPQTKRATHSAYIQFSSSLFLPPDVK